MWIGRRGGTGRSMISLETIKRAVVSKKSHSLQILLVSSGLILAAAVRWLTDRGAYGVPFATFLPIIVLAAIFLDWGYAVAAASLSVAIVNLLFGVTFAGLAWPTLVLGLAYLLTGAFMILTGWVLRRTIQELHRQAEQFQVFNAELQHRAKNGLQIVRALSSRASKAPDPIEFYETMAGRLDLMIKANELLGLGTTLECDIGALTRLAVDPFPPDAVAIQGPAATIADEARMPLIMALHELGTNALKYGALSADGGSVRIEWSTSGGEVQLVWRESGGPQVVTPTKRGLGSRLLTAQSALRSVDLQFPPEGVVCRIAIPRAD
jgi:two-component sensor histidine kinase